MSRPDDGRPIRLEGAIEIPFGLSFDEFYCKFMDFINANNWLYVGYFEDIAAEDEEA